MSWVILFLAGLLEIAWAIGLKYTEGFTRFLPTLGTGLAIALSVALLGMAVRNIPVGTAYAVWSGIGATGTVLYGILYLNEPASLIRLACVGLIVAGIMGLKLVSSS